MSADKTYVLDSNPMGAWAQVTEAGLVDCLAWSTTLGDLAAAADHHAGYWHGEATLADGGFTLRLWCNAPTPADPDTLTGIVDGLAQALQAAGYVAAAG